MSLDTQIELLTAVVYGWTGFTIGIGVYTGNWSAALCAAAGFCVGRAVALWGKRKQQRIDARFDEHLKRLEDEGQ